MNIRLFLYFYSEPDYLAITTGNRSRNLCYDSWSLLLDHTSVVFDFDSSVE